MVHLDLFSGIGGASLAVDAVWENVEHIFCEIDPFCQQVLKKHWPNAQIYGDIRTLRLNSDPDSDRRSNRKEEINSTEGGKQTFNDPARRIDLLTGGFPCQPFSQAGRRKGTADNRHLWPEMLRVIREFKPRWVVGENVAGLLTIDSGLVFEQVCIDLEAEGYEVQPFVIPAVAVNAPHRRDRVWIVANRTSERPNDGEHNRGGRHILRNENGDATEGESQRNGRKRGVGEVGADASNARQQRRSEGNEQGMEANEKERTARTTNDKRCGQDAPHSRTGNPQQRSAPSQWSGERTTTRRKTNSPGIDRGCSNGGRIETTRGRENRNDAWDQNWLEVATELCVLDDGASSRLVRFPDGRKISYSKWRQEALKGLGNAWVPQVAQEIFKGIKAIS